MRILDSNINLNKNYFLLKYCEKGISEFQGTEEPQNG